LAQTPKSSSVGAWVQLFRTLTHAWAACRDAGCLVPPGMLPVPPQQEAAAVGTHAAYPGTPPPSTLGCCKVVYLAEEIQNLSPTLWHFACSPFCSAASPTKRIQPTGDAGRQPAQQKPAALRAGLLAARGDSNSTETQPQPFGDLSSLLSSQTDARCSNVAPPGRFKANIPPVSKPPRQLSLLRGEPGTPRLLAESLDGKWLR